MRAAPLFISFSLLVGLAACSPEPAPQAKPAPEAAKPQETTPAPSKPQEKRQFGAPITESKSTELAELMKEPAKFAGQTVRTEGKVTAVCKSMGCWMEIGDEKGTAHIKMAGHSFFIPKDASGHRAVVQGKMLGAAEEGGACGMGDSCRSDHEKQSGKVAKLELEATGVELVD